MRFFSSSPTRRCLVLALVCSPLLGACATDDGGADVIRSWRAGSIEHHEIVLDGERLTIELLDVDESTVVQVLGAGETELVAVAREQGTFFLAGDDDAWTSRAPESPAATAAELALANELPEPDSESSFRLINGGGFCGFVYRACMYSGAGGCDVEYSNCLGNT